MSRHFTKHIIRSGGAWPLIAAAASLTLTSCATPQQRMAAAESPGTYVAVDQSERVVLPRTSSEGFFVETDGCLAFKPVGTHQMVTPIFPKNGTSFVSDGTHTLAMIVNGSKVTMDRFYTLDGQVPIRSHVKTVADAFPPGCPTSYFLVAGVRRATSDLAALRRFCARTIICKSFGLD